MISGIFNAKDAKTAKGLNSKDAKSAKGFK